MAFVVSDGQLRALNSSVTAGSWAGMPTTIEISSTMWMSYAELWRTQPALRTVVGFLARNVAQLGIDVFERVGDRDRRKAVDHPLARLLECPRPGGKWTKYRLINWTVHELCLYDNAYWIKVRLDGDFALCPMPRRYVDPVGDNPLAPDAYRITGNKGIRFVDPDDVVHFHGYNPDDTRQGVSPIESLRQVLAEEHAAGQYRAQMWRNGARTGGVIERPLGAKWAPEARERFSTDWRALYSGDGAFAGGTPILEDGMVYKPTGISPKDAQYVESRKLTREEVAVAYYLNPQSVGIVGSATQGAAKEFHSQLYRDSLGPILAMLAQDIERQLLVDVDPRAADGSKYVEFNIGEKLRGSFEQQVASMQSAVGGPYMLRSEARAMLNLPHLDEADELIVPLNVTSGGLANPRDTAPDHPSNEESNGQLPGPKPVEISATGGE